LQQKARPSYEFLVVFRQVRVWDQKSAGRTLVEMVCRAWQVWVRSVQGRWGQSFSNSCGAGLNFAGQVRTRL